MDETMESYQDKLEALLDEIAKIDDEEKAIVAVLNSIIAIGQSFSTNVFEFMGLLEEVKFLFREEMMGLIEGDDFVDEEDDDYN